MSVLPGASELRLPISRASEHHQCVCNGTARASKVCLEDTPRSSRIGRADDRKLKKGVDSRNGDRHMGPPNHFPRFKVET